MYFSSEDGLLVPLITYNGYMPWIGQSSVLTGIRVYLCSFKKIYLFVFFLSYKPLSIGKEVESDKESETIYFPIDSNNLCNPYS